MNPFRGQERAYPADLASGLARAGALPARLGRGRPPPSAARSIATVNAGRRPQRDRRAWRLLFDLPRARDLVRRDGPARAARTSHDTSPVCEIGPHPQWGEPGKIVSLDPWGHRVAHDFAELIAEGIDIRPSIAITKARLTLPEIQAAIAAGRLEVDGEIVHEAGDVSVTKIAVDPVWWLPGVAERFGVSEGEPPPLPVRADRRHVSGARHPARPFASSCRRSAA